MKVLHGISIAGTALALAGCTTMSSGSTRVCNAAPGQLFVGQKADASSGLAIVRATGSRELRWAAPDTVMTMEMMEGRVTVAYDREMTITRITCG